MTKSDLLRKSISALAHPVSIAAFLIMVANDHVLRWLYPSWLTGKASDIAWLMVSPLIIGFAIALVWPQSRRADIRLIKAVGFGATATVFALGKSHAAFNHFMNSCFLYLAGAPGGIRLDLTDLLALPFMLLARGPWNSGASPFACFRPAYLALLPAYAILTIANSPAPDYGISRLNAENERLFASSAYGSYSTSDGGLTWVQDECEECYPAWYGDTLVRTTTLVDPRRLARVWRFTQGHTIEASNDGGTTWQVEYDLRPIGEAEEAWYLKTRTGLPMLAQGPLDAIVDASTGNVIFAMGHQGVLVRLPDGSYTSSAVGPYTPEPRSWIARAPYLIAGELVLALDVSVISLAAITFLRSRSTRLAIAAGLITVAVVVTLIIGPPALTSGYGSAVATLALTIITLSCIMLAPFLIARLAKERAHAWHAVWSSLAGAPAFAIPFILWAAKVIPAYWIAAIAAPLLAAATVYAVARLSGPGAGDAAQTASA